MEYPSNGVPCIASRSLALVRNSPENARYMIKLKESRNSWGKHSPVVRLNGALLLSYAQNRGSSQGGESPLTPFWWKLSLFNSREANDSIP